MVRRPNSGNGAQSPVHYLDSAELVQLMELGVPVAATGSGLVVSAEPAWLPAPPQASPPPAPRGSDPVGLGGAVTFDLVSALYVPPGGATRQITVTVIWQLAEPLAEPPGSVTAGNQGVTSKLEMSYGMSVVDLQGGKWYVKGIGASSETVGAR